MDMSGSFTYHAPREWARQALLNPKPRSQQAIPDCERLAHGGAAWLKRTVRITTPEGSYKGIARLSSIHAPGRSAPVR